MHRLKPTVTSQTGKARLGKGFSPDELKEAGLTTQEARRIGMPVDWKRKTSHEENIEALKAHAEASQKTTKPKHAKKKPKN